MKKKTGLTLSFMVCVFFCFCGENAKAQSVANYAVARTTGITYSSIVNTGLPPNSWRNSGTFEEDDNRSFPVPIGFDFWYDGVRYTELSISTNGYIDFSASTAYGGPTTAAYGYANAQYTMPNGTLNSLAPMYDDMTTQGGSDPLGNSIRTLVTGTAPNRILTIEWIDMAVYQNTTPSLNFQVKLHETTGQIEYEYGTMIQGTANFSYTCGINSPTQLNTPTAAQLKCQQTANTTTFNNGQQNNLTQLPASDSKMSFTPPVPANPAGALTFTAVQASQMTLNWANWATNEIGYVIYSSTDGVNYDFITQTAANATSATVTGLYNGTTYYWRVYAVTEGTLSNALSGTQATPGGNTFISVTNGNWNQASTWNINAVPGASDNVIITSTHTVTITATGLACHNLTIGQGGAATLRIGNNNTSRTFTVWGNIIIGNSASLLVPTISNTTHILNVYGNIINNGTVNLQPDNNSFCDVSFLHPYNNQVLSGSGINNLYHNITVDKGSDKTRIVDVQTSTFVATTGFLTLVNGTFKLSPTGTVTLTPFSVTSDIPLHAGLWLNSSTVTVSTTGDINLFGDLTVSSGTMNVGSAADDNVVSCGGLFTINGGAVSVAGRFDRLNTATLTRLTMTAGTLTLATVGSTSTTNAPFMMDIVGSQFFQSGGTIIIHRAGGNAGSHLGFMAIGAVINQVMGGVLQIGDATTPAGQIINVQTVSPVGGFRVVNTNTTADLIAYPLTVMNDVELQSGIFRTNNLDVIAGGNWTNTGGMYTCGTNTTTFNGAASSAINGTAATQVFNNVVVSKSSGSTLSVGGSTTTLKTNNFTETSGNFTAPSTLNIDVATTSSLTLNAGTFTAGNTINIKGDWTNNGGTVAPGTSTTNFTGTAAQAINGTATLHNFYNVVVQKTAGTTLTASSSAATVSVNNFTQTTGNSTFNGTLDVNQSPASAILLSSGTFTPGVAVNITGSWTNNGATCVPGTSIVNFNSTGSQLIGGTAASENFNDVNFLNGGTTNIGFPVSTHNILISATDTLRVGSAGFTISMNGNWTNNGIFKAGTSGIVICNGTSAQTIGGSSTTSFRDLTIQNGAGVSLVHNENIRGSLTLTSGMFTTTGYDFTLLSDANGTGRIAEITGGDITGNIIQQRYIYLGPTSWRQLCAPVSGTTLQDWNDDLVTSGFPGSDFPSMAFYSIASYDETAPGVKENGYSAPSNVTNPLTPNKGYYVYVGPTPVLVAVKGPPVKMNQSFALTRTVSSGGPTQDGWNMIGNPYPSTIDWDAAGWTRTNTDNVLYIWNPNNNQYANYVGGVGVNGGTKYIPSSQAFWIRAIGNAPAVSINETVKSAVDQSFMNTQQQSSVNDMLSLTMHGANGDDQTIVRFAANATDSFDVNFDAMKFASMDTLMPYFASYIDSASDFSINALAPLTSDVTVTLRATAGISGNFTITRDSISNLPNSLCIMLEDLLTGTLTQLSTGASYSFYMSDTTSAPRFLLHFGPALTTGEIPSSCGSTSDGIAFAKGTGNGPWDYTWKDAAGNVIALHPNSSGTDTLTGLVAGNYIVEVTGNSGYCGFRSDTITVDGPTPISIGATIVPSVCSYSADGEIHLNIITGGNPPYTLSWPDGSSNDSLQNLTPGIYSLVITDSAGCQDTSQFIVPTSSTLSASFTATPDTVAVQTLVSFTNYSSGASAYLWDFGDTSQLSATSDPVYFYTNAGNYTVVLVADDGTCSDTVTQNIFVYDNTGLSEHTLSGNVSVIGSEAMISVLFNLPSEEHARIQVYDAAGQLYADRDSYAGQDRVDIPMPGAVGMYMVYVKFAERMYASKVVLIR